MSNASNHWEKTKSLLFKTLAVWAFFAFIIHWFGTFAEQWFVPWQLFYGWHGVLKLPLRFSFFGLS